MPVSPLGAKIYIQSDFARIVPASLPVKSLVSVMVFGARFWGFQTASGDLQRSRTGSAAAPLRWWGWRRRNGVASPLALCFSLFARSPPCLMRFVHTSCERLDIDEDKDRRRGALFFKRCLSEAGQVCL